ncbi:MAG: hypothetical protein OXC26_03080 [Albidovulum sp.]|nr:hypothetical protein [Albidovulum sp.]
MEEKAEAAFHIQLIPTLRQHGIRPIIVAKSVAEELNRLADGQNRQVARQAQAAITMVNNLVDTGNAELIGDNDDDPHADNQFLTIFTKLRRRYPLTIIAQDRGLVRDLLSLNVSNAVQGIREIRAIRINRKGDLMGWALDPSSRDGVKWYPLKSRSPRERLNPRQVDSEQHIQPFSPLPLDHRQVVLDERVVNIKSTPQEGDIVKDKAGNFIRLVAKLGAGGEGAVYETSEAQLVCKIYHRQRLKKYIAGKLDLMVTRRINNPAICWPVSQAYNSCGEMVGYLMPKAEGKALRPFVFVPPLLQKTFPEWTRMDLVKLSSTILEAIGNLQSLNVLLGDINDRNILVQNESTVFLVDCDSYQVENYPCPVGIAPYLSPDLYGKTLSQVLRKEEDESFAISTLVFMLLHLGKPPYSHEGGNAPSENVRRRNFPYPRGEKGAQGVPRGAWRFMWSYLPHYMKDRFHRVFTDGEHLPIGEWQNMIKRYESDLRKGYASKELLPKGFKAPNQSQIKAGIGFSRMCEKCGGAFSTFDKEQATCSRCIGQK